MAQAPSSSISRGSDSLMVRGARLWLRAGVLCMCAVMAAWYPDPGQWGTDTSPRPLSLCLQGPDNATCAPPLVDRSNQLSSISQIGNKEARRGAGPGRGPLGAEPSHSLGPGREAGTVLGTLGEGLAGRCHLYSTPEHTNTQREVTEPRPHSQRGRAETGTQGRLIPEPLATQPSGGIRPPVCCRPGASSPGEEFANTVSFLEPQGSLHPGHTQAWKGISGGAKGRRQEIRHLAPVVPAIMVHWISNLLHTSAHMHSTPAPSHSHRMR